MSAGKTLLAVMAGFAAGAAIGILYAPDRGDVTRRRLLEEGEDFLERTSEELDYTMETAKEMANRVANESVQREQNQRMRSAVAATGPDGNTIS